MSIKVILERDQVLAYDALASAWSGLDFDDRQDVIDLMSNYDFDLAFDYLLGSSTIDPKIADRIRNRPLDSDTD